jgi:hypothetical protein
MTLLFYIVPFVTIFLNAITPALWKGYVNNCPSLKLNQSKQALVFNSEPIDLAAPLLAKRARLSISHETQSRASLGGLPCFYSKCQLTQAWKNCIVL